MSICKKFIAPIVVLVLFSQLCFAKKPEVIVDSQRTRVMLSNEYTYYGIDFSKLRLINSAKMAQGESIKNTFCPAWLGKFDEYYTEGYLRPRLGAEILNDERYPFQAEQYLKNNPSTIVNLYATAWSVDTLRMMVKDYQLVRKSGIGISFIISEFNKNEEEVIGYVSFFDIETRELLFVIKTYGKALGTGMTNHWFNGLYKAWNDYFYQTFNTDKKKVIKAER